MKKNKTPKEIYDAFDLFFRQFTELTQELCSADERLKDNVAIMAEAYLDAYFISLYTYESKTKENTSELTQKAKVVAAAFIDATKLNTLMGITNTKESVDKVFSKVSVLNSMLKTNGNFNEDEYGAAVFAKELFDSIDELPEEDKEELVNKLYEKTIIPSCKKIDDVFNILQNSSATKNIHYSENDINHEKKKTLNATKQKSSTKLKEKIWYLLGGTILIIIITFYISFRFNNNRANDIISRYDGYLETVDSLANGCSPLPSNLKGFAEEILKLDNYNISNVNLEACSELTNIDPAYFMNLKDTVRQMAVDRYYEETNSSFFFKISDLVQCFVKSCPVVKIKTHYHF